MNTARLDFLDIAKGITVLWVVWMHMEMPMHIWACFQMPLFFFISGTLYKQPAIGKTKEWIKKKAKVLLIPAITFFFISLIIILFRDGKVYGSNILWKMHTICQASIIWFLQAMFIYLCGHYVFVKYCKWKYTGLFISLIFYPIGYYLNISKEDNIIPCLFISSILIFWMYFEVGCLWGRKYDLITDESRKNKRYILILLSIIFSVIVCTPYLNNLFFRSIFNGANYLVPVYSIVYNFCMIFIIRNISYLISRLNISNVIKFYGVNSLVVYLSHWPIYMYIFKPLIAEGMNKYFAYVLVIFIVSICIFIFNKFCPKLIGK